MNLENKYKLQSTTDALCQEHKVNVKGKSYDVVLHADTEDGGFWAESPSLPGCDSQDDTVEETLKMMKDAIKGHLEVE